MEDRFGFWLGVFMLLLMAGCLWLSADAQETKSTYVERCEAQGGLPITPRPGSEWACIAPEALMEI